MVDDATPTPDPELEDDAEGTPEGEPAQGTTPEPAADKSPAAAPPPASQAEFTRAQQFYAEAKTTLGLPGTATRAEVNAKLAALRAGEAPDGEPDEDETPRERELRERAERAEEQALVTAMEAERTVSGDFADAAFKFASLTRTTNDVRAIVQAARELVLEHRDSFLEETGDEEPGEEPGTPEADIGLSEGESPTARPQVDAGRRNRETGAIGAVRGLFKAAAEANRR